MHCNRHGGDHSQGRPAREPPGYEIEDQHDECEAGGGAKHACAGHNPKAESPTEP
jgi:hypothetical protein